MSEKQYDAIIIGGGHNGLVCASIVSKKNKKVLICEARETCGGMFGNGLLPTFLLIQDLNTTIMILVSTTVNLWSTRLY